MRRLGIERKILQNFKKEGKIKMNFPGGFYLQAPLDRQGVFYYGKYYFFNRWS